jgi:hypothetical protein
MAAFDWAALDSGLVAFVRGVFGMPTGQVVWANQSGTRPLPPFVELNRPDDTPIGGVEPELTSTYDAGQPNGSQLQYDTRTPVDFDLHVNYFEAATNGQGATKPTTKLAALRAALGTPSGVDALAALGVAVRDNGKVLDTSAVLTSDIEPRATIVIRLGVMDGAHDAGTWIETVVPPTGTVTP